MQFGYNLISTHHSINQSLLIEGISNKLLKPRTRHTCKRGIWILYLKIGYREKVNSATNSVTVHLSLTQANLCFPRCRISPGLTGMKGTREILHTIQFNTTQHNTTQHNTTQHNTTQYNFIKSRGHREWSPSLPSQGLVLKMLD